MRKIVSCEFNIDTACVELCLEDGTLLSIDCTAVENEMASSMYRRSELDWLIYNETLAYAELILNGDIANYPKRVDYMNDKINRTKYKLFLNRDNFIIDKFDLLAYTRNSSKANFFRTCLLFISHDKRGERMKLRDLASVRSGLVLSRKQAKEPSEYRYPLINLRCTQQEGTIQLNEADIYEAKEPLKEEYLSQSGDIIVRLTAPYTAVLIDETTSGMVVSSNFVVIRVEDKSLLPEYLFWLLNTEKIKRKIYENATSNMLCAVNARFLADFELALLSVEDQRKIAQFNLMAKRERQLLRMLADEKQKYYAGVLNQAYKRAKKGK